MEMSKKTIYKFIVLVIILISLVFGFYYYLGIGFGKAVVKTTKGLENAKQDWKNKGINPIDSVRTKIIEVIDSSGIE